MKFKKGDTVIVAVGKDKGRKGKIEKLFPKVSRALVSGVNMYKRHLKKRDEKNPGGIVDISHPIEVSKLSIFCTKCNATTRVGYLITKKEKTRICRRCSSKI